MWRKFGSPKGGLDDTQFMHCSRRVAALCKRRRTTRVTWITLEFDVGARLRHGKVSSAAGDRVPQGVEGEAHASSVSEYIGEAVDEETPGSCWCRKTREEEITYMCRLQVHEYASEQHVREVTGRLSISVERVDANKGKVTSSV